MAHRHQAEHAVVDTIEHIALEIDTRYVQLEPVIRQHAAKAQQPVAVIEVEKMAPNAAPVALCELLDQDGGAWFAVLRLAAPCPAQPAVKLDRKRGR